MSRRLSEGGATRPILLPWGVGRPRDEATRDAVKEAHREHPEMTQAELAAHVGEQLGHPVGRRLVASVVPGRPKMERVKVPAELVRWAEGHGGVVAVLEARRQEMKVRRGSG